MAKMGNSAGPGLGGDQVQSLLIDVRASTQGFSEDIAAMRGTFDSTLVEGFSRAGNVLEKGLLGAIRRGSLGFDDLKRVALDAMGQIAAQSVGNLFHSGGSNSGGGLLGGLGSLVGSILGLPGRATGGTVSPGRGYLVGERGPELFIPTSAGRVESNATARGGAREVRVSINVITPPGSGAPQALQRSTRQVASAVRRALTSS
jgi:hypothetical protein